MSKGKKITLLILGLIIIALIIGIIIVNNKPKLKIVTEKEFVGNYNEINKNNQSIYPLKEHVYKKESKKDTYLFDDKVYLVIGRKNKQFEKVYLYTSKDYDYRDYLLNMIKSINPNLNEKESLKIFDKMVDIDNKKADELGLLINFEKDGYNYITMEKENGKDISFFIYQPKE